MKQKSNNPNLSKPEQRKSGLDSNIILSLSLFTKYIVNADLRRNHKVHLWMDGKNNTEWKRY